ncbi:UDP-galactose transporter senju [Dermatophagoides farinae]|uniref:UDP-galactose transporter senju n=1 Tax=Dermatophagoides farinae TaxID=6954 RepID=UPI003F617449
MMKLFTTNWHRIFFITYILLFVIQSQLIKLIHVDTATSNYMMMISTTTIHPTTIVLATEILKLLLAISIYVKDNDFRYIPNELFGHNRLLLLSCIPAILYCIVNNLQFINMSHYDPVTYSVWMQCRLIATGIVYQFVFKRYLNRIQWLSLTLLTIGCIFKQFDHINWSLFDSWFRTFEFHVQLPDRYIILVIVQILCSTIGGVYNEYLIKESQATVHLMMQNIYNYILSIGFNLLFIFTMIPSDHGQRWRIMNLIVFDDYQQNFWFFILIINNALCGMAASIFLSQFNSIMKVFATGCHLILVTFISYWLLNVAVNLFTFTSIIIVSFSIYLYVKNPVISINNNNNNNDKIRAN